MSELMSLRRLASHGRGVSVALSGPAGIGKSFKASGFLSTLPCRSLHLLADAPLTSVFRMVPALPREPEWVSNVIRRLERREQVSAEQLASALHARLNLHVPVVLLVDHLQRCTPAQLDFWKALGELVRGSKGMGLLGLTRSQAPAGWADVEIEPLYRPESDALVEVTLGTKAPQPFLDWLYDRAQGHPLYTLELIRHAQRQGAVQILDGQARWKKPERDTLPPTLEGLVHSLLPPQLSEGSWRVLAELLLTNQPPQTTPEVMQQLEDLGLSQGGKLGHPLYAEVLMAAVPLPILKEVLEDLSKRQALGDLLRVARLLEQLKITDSQTYDIWREAARQAEAQGQLQQAAQWWAKTAPFVEPAEAVTALWQASRLLHEAAAQNLPDPQSKRQQARQWAWQAAAKQIQIGQALSLDNWRFLTTLQASVSEPLADLVQADFVTARPDQAVWAELSDLYQIAFFSGVSQGDTAEILRRWELLPAHLQAKVDGPALRCYGTALMLSLKLDEAQDVLQEAVRRCDDPYHKAITFNNMALIPLYRGEFEKARPLLEEVAAVAANLSDPSKRAYLLNLSQVNLSMVYERAGELRRAYDAVLSLTNNAGELELRYLYQGLSFAGGRAFLLGEFAKSQSLLNEALDLSPYIASHAIQSAALLWLIRLYFYWPSEHSAALLAHFTARLEQLIAPIPDAEVFESLCLVALGLAACGHPAAATDYLSRAEKVAQDIHMTQGFPLIAWTKSVLHAEQGDEPGAAALAEEAERLARESGDALKASEYALWAAYYHHDAAALEQETHYLSGLEFHGIVQGVWARWQQREAISSPLAQPVATLPHLHVLGDIHIYRPDGSPFTSRSAAHLLVLLLCARLTGEDGLSLSEVAEDLFPERDEPNALRALRRLLARLRQELGPGVVRQSGERLLLGDIHSDAELFLQTQEPDLWRGPFLNGDLGSEFTDAARTLLLTRLEGLTEALLDTDAETAERLAALLCRCEPYEKRLLALHLRAHDAANHPRQAGAAYRKAREQYAEVGEDLPAEWQTFLAKQVGQSAMPALVALSSGPAQGTVSAARQARALQVHRSTISRWQKGEIQRPGERGRPAKLTDEQLAEVQRVFADSPQKVGFQGEQWSLAALAEYVDKTYSVRLSRSQLSRLLRRNQSAEALYGIKMIR